MKPRILLAEDDQSVLRVTKLRLEHEGYDVVVARDGEEALQRVAADGPVHLVLVDLKMPRRNGYEVCRELKAQSNTSHIPVIVFTGSEYHLKRLAEQCLKVGADDWIAKPFRTIDLLQKVRRVLTGREPAHD